MGVHVCRKSHLYVTTYQQYHFVLVDTFSDVGVINSDAWCGVVQSVAHRTRHAGQLIDKISSCFECALLVGRTLLKYLALNSNGLSVPVMVTHVCD